MSTLAAVPEPVIVKRWRCPFCHRSRSSRQATAEHIGRCWLNPDVRSCMTCAHLEPGHDACGCVTGCNWGSPAGAIPNSCTAGIKLDGTVQTGCPLWAFGPRRDAE